MIKIRFSHRYNKMPGTYSRSKLLAVIPVRLEDLPEPLLAYDTAYFEGGNLKYYPLPMRGDYMILMLQSRSGHLRTTIRSQRGKGGADKLAYYRSHVGEVVECVISEEG